jgi:cytidylate kinase
VSPLSVVSRLLSVDPAWSEQARGLIDSSGGGPNVHLAVFVEPYLEYVLTGQKTIESRFSAVRFPPYGRVARGDLVLLKASGGPVVGICEVGAAWFYQLNANSWKTIRRDFSAAICAQDPDFWRRREHAEFATLMYVSRAKRLPPVAWPKKDRRGWVILRGGQGAPLFGGSMKSTVVGVSGGIASGKSTLSEAVALCLGCPHVSFGGYVRSEAKRRGLGVDRSSLQTLGEELVASDPDKLCEGVLRQGEWIPGGPLIVDGIRHVEIAERIRQLVKPSDFRLIHLEAPAIAREARLAARGENGPRLVDLDRHSTEHEVSVSLPQIANLTLDGTLPIEQLIEAAAKWADGLE